MLKRQIAIVAAVMAVALSAVSVASAASSLVNGYGGQASTPQAEVAPPVVAVAPASAQGQSGTLPFTGLDLGVAVGIGAVLLGGGVLLRRASREN
jgi:hypothetical protein